MQTRGRKSAAAQLAEVANTGGKLTVLKQRPAPPADFNEREQVIWHSIVNSQAVDWFSPGDQPLLVAYCKAIHLHERTSREAEGAELIVMTSQGAQMPNPIFRLQDMAARQIASLAVKLRLAQSTKWTEQKAATKAKHENGVESPWAKQAAGQA